MHRKCITCFKGGALFVIVLKIDYINASLRLIYEAYELKDKKLNQSVEETFKTNPDSEVFDNLPLEKRFIHQLSQLEAGEVLSKFSSFDYSNLNNIKELRLPKMQINLEQYKIITIYNFIRFFFENYEQIKLNSDSNNVDSNSEIPPPIINKIELNDIFNIIGKKNNLLIYFIHTYMDKFYFNLKTNSFELTNKTLKLFINNFIYDTDTTDSKNLYLLICNLSETDEEIKNTLNILFKTLIKIINNDILINKITEENLLKLNVLNILCLIYGVRFLFGTKISYEKIKYLLVLNHIYLQLIKSFKNLDYDRIEIYESLEIIDHGGEVTEKLDLKAISKKYNYLINLSKEEFIKSILNDIKSNNVEVNNKVPEHLLLNSPRILNIEFLLTLDNSVNSLINYKRQNTPNFITSKNVITEEYMQILYIINSNGFISKDKLDLRVTKFADVIISDILPLLDKRYEMCISTLIIMTDIVDTILKDKEYIDTQSKLFLVYKIIIPYLYDKYNITKFIDYFL